MKIGNFKYINMLCFKYFRVKKVANIPSEDPNFHLVYNSSNLGFFVSPHGSSLCYMAS